jgi:hypothetical protein
MSGGALCFKHRHKAVAPVAATVLMDERRECVEMLNAGSLPVCASASVRLQVETPVRIADHCSD